MKIKIRKGDAIWCRSACGTRELVIDHEVITERLPSDFIVRALTKTAECIATNTADETCWIWHICVHHAGGKIQVWVEATEKELKDVYKSRRSL